MWGREDAQLTAQSLPTRAYERVWLPSKSLGGAAAGFAGIFFSGYGPPSSAGRCDGGPTNATCGRANAAGDEARSGHGLVPVWSWSGHGLVTGMQL